MSSRQQLVFKVATDDVEFEQIHRLNYRTFAVEIPQHQRSATERIVDKYHAQNTYLICLSGTQLVGMLAVRGTRPFSLDQKLEHLDSLLPEGRKVCEIRLLAIERRFRGAQVLQGMLALLWQHGIERGYDLAIISGTTRQLRLYRHLGFVPFGPMVGTGDARFQPMYVTLQTFEAIARDFLRPSPRTPVPHGTLNFLPGPVAVRPEVRRAFEQPPESHRSDAFIDDWVAARKALTDLTHAGKVALFLGSGTLANDVVGAQLSLGKARGLVVSNGEFGERLIDHATRFQLAFEAQEYSWGRSLDYDAIRTALRRTPAPGWLWCAHCETSTGVLNDLERLKVLCADSGVRLCLDGISSIGTTPVDLTGVYLASCASGKGLRAYPGIAMVFHHHDVAPQPERLPRYLDLGYCARHQGVPFTFSSNLLHALHAATRDVDWERRFADVAALAAFLRAGLDDLGLERIGTGVSPAVTTLALPAEMRSVETGGLLRDAGYLLSCHSEYLQRRNWIQICLMGECTQDNVASLLDALERFGIRHSYRNATIGSIRAARRAGSQLAPSPTTASSSAMPR
jgi:aspartate aminotransferase-like enzyme